MHAGRILAVAVLTLSAPATAAVAPPPPLTAIARGGSSTSMPPRSHPAVTLAGGAVDGGILIASRRGIGAWPYFTMHPHVGCCEWYDTFDWRHRAVLVVVATLPHEFEIAGLTRRGDTLRVTIAARYPGQADLPDLTRLWEAVGVPRSLLGSPLPRRVVVVAD